MLSYRENWNCFVKPGKLVWGGLSFSCRGVYRRREGRVEIWCVCQKSTARLGALCGLR